MTALARKHSKLARVTRAAFAKNQLPAVILRSQPATAAVVNGPILLRRAGGRPQCRATSLRCKRVSGMSPAIHPRESPIAADSSAIIQQLQELTFSLNPLSNSLSRPAIQIIYPLVQKLWRKRLPCGSRRKTKNEILGPDIELF